MQMEVITKRDDLLIRRHILEPGEALPWHIDLCHRFTVVVRGERLHIEFRDTGEIAVVPVHRGVNVGAVPYEEVIMFFLDSPGLDPQPEQA